MSAENALAKAGQSRIAASFQDWTPGQILYVDRAGRALTPSQYRRTVALAYGRAGMFVAGVAGLMGWGLGAGWGVLYGAVLTGMIAVRTIRWRRVTTLIQQAAQLASNGRMEEAHAALTDLLPRFGRGTPLRLHVMNRLASAELALRRPADALARLDQMVERAKRIGRDPYGDMAAAMRVEALVQLGRFPEARQERDAFGADSPSEVVNVGRQAATLSLAFQTGAPEDLPPETKLHDWAHDALALSSFGGLLVLLSWAFHQRGDEDMARHLLSEAPARMPLWPLEKSNPKLHAWMVERIKIWEID